MRIAHAALGCLMIGVAAVLVAAGGKIGASPAPAGPDGAEDLAAARPEGTGQPTAQKATQPASSTVHAPARAIDPEAIAPPDLATDELERLEPRPPLSELALAGPPKPKPPGEWKGKPLFQPVATAAGLIQAKGYTIAISGIDVVKPDETCIDTKGKSWSCGIAARTAFRAFLRGRAVTCTTPPEGGPDTIAAACSIGKQDIGAWLAQNGWARPLKTGPYAEAGDAARKAGKGIFGAAPDLSDLPPPPPPVETTTPVSPSILDLSGTAATPPVDQPAPAQ